MARVKCPNCDGNGEVLMAKMSEHGVGILGLTTCPTCHGTGYVWKKPTVKRMKKIAKIIKENQ